MNNQLKESMEKVIENTMKLGADSCDLILSKGKSFSLSSQNEKIDKYQVSGSQVMGLRVIKNNKVGLSYSESMDADAVGHMISAAVENAKNAPENPYEKILIKDSEVISENKYTKDETSLDKKVEFCLKLESEVKKRDERVKVVPYNGLSEALSEKYYMNSLSTFTFDSEYYLSCYSSALINNENDSSMHYHSSLARNMQDLQFDECIDESLKHASCWLGAKPLKTGKYDVIFTLDIFASLFSMFGNIFSAKAAMEKTNPFADRLGAKVMNEKLSVTDIPNYAPAFFKSTCDAEGQKHTDLCLVENGVLKSFYQNSATAQFFKTNSTAHAARGAKSALSISSTTQVISAGDIRDTELKAKEYFEVHAVQGLGSGSNAISGDFSFAASGYLVANGERKPVKGVTISGNFHKMLLDIKKIGDTIHGTNDKGFFAPIMRFEDLSVAGI